MSKKPIRIALDAMGGDHAPYEIVKGGVIAARDHEVEILLVGDEAAIKKELVKHDTQGLTLEIIHATEIIGMDESPATALRRKKDSSIVVAAKTVKSGNAQAMIAMGNTGAAMGSAVFHVGRIKGIDRPAIAVVLPSLGDPCILIDAGANADCIPEMLVQFANMGSIFIENVYKVKNPRVGLLNIGEEAGKGNTFVNAAFDLLEKESSINFIGNIEGKDMFVGNVEVATCDGFTGNVALKSAEGVTKMFTTILKEQLKKSIATKAGALLSKSAFAEAKKKIDPEEYGGALLLGIQGICVIGHGASTSHAVNNAVRVAKEAIQTDVLGKIESQVSELGAQTV